MLKAALTYADLGWRILPLEPGRKEPLGRFVPHGCKDASSNGDDLLRWWGEVPDAGIAVATGAESGVWVLDIDGPVGAVVWWDWEARHEPIHTLAQRTGRTDGGRQLFFRWPQELIVRNKAKVMPGIDVRGEGGYVVLPPSLHPDGRRYQWEGTWEGRVMAAHAPAKLLKLVQAERTKSTQSRRQDVWSTTPYGRKAADDLELDLASCGRGGRDQEAFRVAVRLMELERDRQLAPGEVEDVMRRALRRNGYLADQRKERGERGLARVLGSARRRLGG
jgi:hypothetical protein